MPRPLPATFARFVSVPENRSALAAVRHLADSFRSRQLEPAYHPLFLHGPAGTGKTYLVSALVEDVTRHSPDRVVSVLSAGDFRVRSASAEPAEEDRFIEHARACDLLIVEDLQHSNASSFEALTQIFDDRLARRNPMVFTALVGPKHLEMPARLASRLASGLVVALESLSVPSRLALLLDKAQRRQLAVSRDVLAWLAEYLTGGGRQLEGALSSLETLSRLHGPALTVAITADHFREQVDSARPSVERIVQRVGRCFHVEPRQLQSEQRGRHVLLPRQVGMYLARQLTPLSLEQIGSYFGGRDHSTVLHACRKVEQALTSDPVLSGTVRQLQAELA